MMVRVLTYGFLITNTLHLFFVFGPFRNRSQGLLWPFTKYLVTEAVAGALGLTLRGMARQGDDLGQHGLTSYMFDIIYVTWFVHTTTALISNKFWYTYIVVRIDYVCACCFVMPICCFPLLDPPLCRLFRLHQARRPVPARRKGSFEGHHVHLLWVRQCRCNSTTRCSPTRACREQATGQAAEACRSWRSPCTVSATVITRVLPTAQACLFMLHPLHNLVSPLVWDGVQCIEYSAILRI